MSTDANYYRLAMKIFADFSGTIAVPAILAALFGDWLDKKYDTEPRYLIILLILAFLSTAISIKRKAKKYLKEYESLDPNRRG